MADLVNRLRRPPQSSGPASSSHDSGRAWSMAWTLGITEMILWGALFYAFSALLVPMQHEFGWSTGAITGAYSLALLISGIAAPWVGRYIDRHGARWVMTAGSMLGSLTLVAWSQVQSLTGFYAVWIVMGIALAGTLYEPAFAAIAPWFRQNRGKAMLIVTFFGGLASTVFLPLTGWLEVRFGWRDALLVLAGIVAIGTILPHALVLRAPVRAEADRHHRPSASWGELIGSPWFRRIAFAFFLQTFTTLGVAVHMIAYLIDQGVSPTTAAWTAGMIGAAQTGSRVLVTLFEHAASTEVLTAIMFGVQMLSIAILVVWPSGPAILVAALLLGIGRGALTLLRPTLLLEHYNVREFGAVNGSLALVLTFANAAAPVATGLANGWLGGYTWVFATYAFLSLCSGVVLWSSRFVAAPEVADAP